MDDDDDDGYDASQRTPETKKKKKKKKAAGMVHSENPLNENPLFPEGDTDDNGALEGLDPSSRPEAMAHDGFRSTTKTDNQLSAEDQILIYTHKQFGAYVFIGLQCFYAVVGVTDIIVGTTVASEEEYGHDHSMQVFVAFGILMMTLGVAGIFGATKRKSILPFHFFGTVILFIIMFNLCVFTFFRESTVDDYIDENYVQILAKKKVESSAMSKQDMKDGVDVLMSLVATLGLVTCVCFIVSQVLILWLIGTTRTIGAILVTVDGTLICGGMMVMLAGIEAGAETTAFTSLLKFSVQAAIPVGVYMILLGVIFMVMKQKALSEAESILERDPKTAWGFVGVRASKVADAFTSGALQC
jgi:hypothetical protein